MLLSGWGRYPQTLAELVEPLDSSSAQRLIEAHRSDAPLIPRGAGRSYGDSALAQLVVSSRFLDSFIDLDAESGTLRCGAGVRLNEILQLLVPRGFFLPVVPGSQLITVGGAIAADVHGKNHHRDGSFCDHVEEFSLLTAAGELLRCSRQEHADVFHASCAGMGLTGMIVDATLTLSRLNSSKIRQRALRADGLQESLEQITANADSHYSVAWIDCLARGDRLGRSVLFLGEHGVGGSSGSDHLRSKPGRQIAVPFNTPSLLLNKYSMSLFNSLYFARHSVSGKSKLLDYQKAFFPLDSIKYWNRLYGRNGFLQYQFVVPNESAEKAIRAVLEEVSSRGMGSFLAVLKQFGAANQNLLSFPREGFTLTLDFKRERRLFPLLQRLDDIVSDHGGRLYLAKDARMSEQMFKQGYPRWEEFMAIKERLDPDSVFTSLQSKRLGLSR
jgi:FAD/FMN-containing dehydrogenase